MTLCMGKVFVLQFFKSEIQYSYLVKFVWTTLCLCRGGSRNFEKGGVGQLPDSIPHPRIPSKTKLSTVAFNGCYNTSCLQQKYNTSQSQQKFLFQTLGSNNNVYLNWAKMKSVHGYGVSLLKWVEKASAAKKEGGGRGGWETGPLAPSPKSTNCHVSFL